MVRILVPVYVIAILSLPLGFAVFPLVLAESLLTRAIAAFAILPLYVIAYVLTCGLLSRPHRWAIQEGRFERSLSDRTYGRRRLHAMCWTSIYYSPSYAYVLSLSWLKWLLFRLFGYRGVLDFTCYPDNWIRDLPLLRIGSGAYLSNKSTIGSNLALKDGGILVEGIAIGSGAMIGHLTMVAAGSELGDNAELSHGTACGVRVKMGGAIVKPDCCIDHKARIGAMAVVGTRSYVGLAVVIGQGVKIPPGGNIPSRARLMTQQDVDRYTSSETKDLNHLREELMRLIGREGNSP